MNQEDQGMDKLQQLESRLRDAVDGGPAPMADAASDRVLSRVRSHVRANPHGTRRGWSNRFFIFAAIAAPAAAAGAIALAVIANQPHKALVPAPAGTPRAVPSAAVSPSAVALSTVLVESSTPANMIGPVTVHWVTTNGTELASRQLPTNEAILGAGGSHLLVYRTDGHVLDFHMDGTSEDVGSGMPTSTAPGQASLPVRALVSPDGTQWIWGQIVSQSGNSVTSKIALAGIGASPRTVAQAIEDNRALEPYRWTLANPVIAHGRMGVGGYLLFTYVSGQAEQLDLATGKRSAVGDGDASVVDVAANGAMAEIPSKFSGGSLTVTGPGQRSQSAALPSGGQAGGVMFDAGSNHLVFATSPASGPPHERFETDVIDLNSGARTKLGPADLRPAGWLPDGRLVEFRTSSDGDGSPGTYLVSLDGSATKVSSYQDFVGITQLPVP